MTRKHARSAIVDTGGDHPLRRRGSRSEKDRGTFAERLATFLPRSYRSPATGFQSFLSLEDVFASEGFARWLSDTGCRQVLGLISIVEGAATWVGENLRFRGNPVRFYLSRCLVCDGWTVFQARD